MIITCLECGEARTGTLVRGQGCPKCGSVKIYVRPCVEGHKGPEGSPGADQLDFYEGDRIGDCQLIRRTDGDRHCIIAFFLVKRGSGSLDIFVAGTGRLQEKLGVTPGFVRLFMDDMRRMRMTQSSKLPYPVEWEQVDLQDCTTVQELAAALQRAGVKIWSSAL